eukprot:5359362-Ditylum_brightwellii.AAC.1
MDMNVNRVRSDTGMRVYLPHIDLKLDNDPTGIEVKSNVAKPGQGWEECTGDSLTVTYQGRLNATYNGRWNSQSHRDNL